VDAILEVVFFIFRFIIGFIVRLYVEVIIEILFRKTGKLLLLNKKATNKTYSFVGAIFWTIFAIVLAIFLIKKGVLPPLF